MCMNMYLSVGFVVLVTDEDLLFPVDYPTSCLLGCVDMVDCLPQEEYRDQVGVVSHRGQLLCANYLQVVSSPGGTINAV